MFELKNNKNGVSIVEYALLAALIGTASVLAVTTFGTQTASLFERENLRLAESNVGGDNGSGGSTGSGDGLGDQPQVSRPSHVLRHMLVIISANRTIAVIEHPQAATLSRLLSSCRSGW